MTRNEVRQTINTEGQRHTLVIYFTKRNGELRRMVCRYFGATSRKAHLMEVWDMEKGAVRCVNLDTVDRINVLTPRKDRPPVPPKRSFEDVRREVQELFY